MSITAKTQNEFVTEVANILGVKKASTFADGTTTYETRIKQWLYWAHLSIARIYAFPELDADRVLYNLVVGAGRYLFSDILLLRTRQILGVVVVDAASTHNSRKLTQVLPRRFDQDYPDPQNQRAADIPEIYTIYGRAIEVFPWPDTTYVSKWRYNQWPKDFATGASTSQFIDKDDLIIAATMVHAYQSLMEQEDAKDWARTFSGLMASAIGPETDPADWEPEGRAFDMVAGRPTNDFHKDPLVFFNP